MFSSPVADRTRIYARKNIAQYFLNLFCSQFLEILINQNIIWSF